MTISKGWQVIIASNEMLDEVLSLSVVCLEKKLIGGPVTHKNAVQLPKLFHEVE